MRGARLVVPAQVVWCQAVTVRWGGAWRTHCLVLRRGILKFGDLDAAGDTCCARTPPAWNSSGVHGWRGVVEGGWLSLGERCLPGSTGLGLSVGHAYPPAVAAGDSELRTRRPGCGACCCSDFGSKHDHTGATAPRHGRRAI